MVAQGGLILANDYNTIQSTVSNVLGTGSSDAGYGQTVTSQQVSVGTTISAQSAANQWVKLYTDIVTCATHQGTDVSALTTAYTANVASGKLVNASDVNLFSTAASNLNTNRLQVAAAQYVTESFSPDISNSRTTAWGSISQTTIQHSFTVTFASADAARYFFNTGGRILMSGSLTGYSGVQGGNWANLLSTMGTVAFGARDTTAASGTPTSNFGYYSLTGSNQQMFTKAGTSYNGISVYYTANDYTVYARTASAGAQVLIDIYLNDDAKNATNYDSVDGTVTSTIQIKRSTGSSTVNITAPTATNTVTL